MIKLKKKLYIFIRYVISMRLRIIPFRLHICVGVTYTNASYHNIYDKNMYNCILHIHIFSYYFYSN